MAQDIQWIQRHQSFKKALTQLDSAVGILKERNLNQLEQLGLIKTFEFSFELAWNTLKDFYQYQGESLQGSRDAIRLAFKQGLIEDGEAWMKMLENRNRTSHTYNEETAKEIIEAIISTYHGLFLALSTRLSSLENQNS